MFEVITKFRNEYKFLSNFYLCDVIYNGTKYASSEHAYQAQKCIDEEDILKFTNITAGKAKELGNELLKTRKDWTEQKKTDIMFNIVKAKFEQNPHLKEKLKETKKILLIEGNNWHDNFWGDCSCDKCKSKTGRNVLGKILMLIRTKI